MKRHLQTLWEEIFPGSGPAPGPETDAVLRRVGEAIDGSPRRGYRRRAARTALLLAAVLALLTGMALALQAGLPAQNVISAFFWHSEGTEFAESLVSGETLSLSDENYTMTVTSTAADRHEVYFTLTVTPKTEAAREAALRWDNEEGSKLDLFDYRTGILRSTSGGSTISVDPETGVLEVAVNLRIYWPLTRSVSVRCGWMKDVRWLRIPVHPVSTVKRKINAEAPGMPNSHGPYGGTVRIEKIELSPMTMYFEYSSPIDNIGTPVPYFLWKDGTVSTRGQLSLRQSGGSGTFGEERYTCKETWKFNPMQDISRMEAVIFGDTAYPLDGGAPYPYDASGLPFPFFVPSGEEDTGVPLDALCEGLGASYTWDEATRTATASYRGVTLTFADGTDTVLVDDGADYYGMQDPAVFRDGTLLVSIPGLEWGLVVEYVWAKDKDGKPFDTGSGYVVIP